MKKIYIKFIGDVTIFFLLSVMSVAAIVWVIQAVNFLDFVSEDGHSFNTYFKYTLLVFPKIIGKVFPFIFFISLTFVILKYESNNELIIFWSHGVTKMNLVNLIIKYSLLASILLLSITIYIIPKSQDKARSYIRASSLDLMPSLIKEESFNDIVKDLTIFVDKKTQYGEFENIFLKDSIGFTDTENQFKIIYAKKGKFKNSNNVNYLTLFDGIFLLSENDKFTNFTFKKIDFDLSKFGTKTTTYTKIQELQSMYLINCIYYLDTYVPSESEISFNLFKEVQKRCTDRFRPEALQELFERVVVAFYIPVLGLLSALCILLSKDQYNYNRMKVVIFGFGFLTIIVHEISSQYFIMNIVTNILFSILPIVSFLTLYFFINKKLKFN
jgi:lipopolysaccharide export system permease protein